MFSSPRTREIDSASNQSGPIRASSNAGRLRLSADRDHGRARQRNMRASKPELVERLLIFERAYAKVEKRWLRTADDMLVCIMLLDRVLARFGPTSLDDIDRER